MDKVFIVTRGVYSDYGIEAVFAQEEDANAFIGRARAVGYSDDPMNVEEWPLFGAGKGPVFTVTYHGRAVITADGEVRYYYWSNYNCWSNLEEADVAVAALNKRAARRGDWETRGVVELLAVAATRERVEKIVQDWAAEVLAEWAGIS